MQGSRLNLVHGFTQTGRSWGSFGEELGKTHDLLKVDAPGHGRSEAIRADLPEAAAFLIAAAGEGDYLGYSLGGRICLRAALDHPGSVSRLVLVSSSPGIADPADRQARLRADEALAGSITDVEEFIDRWLAQPLFAGLPPDSAQRTSRLENTAEGLSSSLRLCGTGAQEPLWDRLGLLSMPVMLLVGADDAKFCRIATEMADAIGPNASLVSIAGAGHSVHLERPHEAAAAVTRFLARPIR